MWRSVSEKHGRGIEGGMGFCVEAIYVPLCRRRLGQVVPISTNSVRTRGDWFCSLDQILSLGGRATMHEYVPPYFCDCKGF